jgi:hypothetical protein
VCENGRAPKRLLEEAVRSTMPPPEFPKGNHGLLASVLYERQLGLPILDILEKGGKRQCPACPTSPTQLTGSY